MSNLVYNTINWLAAVRAKSRIARNFRRAVWSIWLGWAFIIASRWSIMWVGFVSKAVDQTWLGWNAALRGTNGFRGMDVYIKLEREGLTSLKCSLGTLVTGSSATNSAGT